MTNEILCLTPQFVEKKHDELVKRWNAYDDLVAVLDEAYGELIADSHRDGARCLLLTRMEAALAKANKEVVSA